MFKIQACQLQKEVDDIILLVASDEKLCFENFGK
jgi:hypothetical protein